VSDPTSLDWYPVEDENRRDAMRDEAFWDQACPHTNSAGEHCAYTIHLTGLHTWETK
jgi:hypothetical protein